MVPHPVRVLRRAVPWVVMSASSSALSPRRRARVRAQAFPKRLVLTKRTCGTNGWMSLWGSNAHGEIAGCPPPAA